jgi:hypothetical protein
MVICERNVYEVGWINGDLEKVSQTAVRAAQQSAG